MAELERVYGSLYKFPKQNSEQKLIENSKPLGTPIVPVIEASLTKNDVSQMIQKGIEESMQKVMNFPRAEEKQKPLSKDEVSHMIEKNTEEMIKKISQNDTKSEIIAKEDTTNELLNNAFIVTTTQVLLIVVIVVLVMCFIYMIWRLCIMTAKLKKKT